MADEILSRDQNHITVLGAVTDNDAQEIRMLRVDPTTKRLLIAATGGGGTGVTSIGTLDSVTPSANGLVISGTTLYAQSASETVPGMVSIGNQVFKGIKIISNTFTDPLLVPAYSFGVVSDYNNSVNNNGLYLGGYIRALNSGNNDESAGFLSGLQTSATIVGNGNLAGSVGAVNDSSIALGSSADIGFMTGTIGTITHEGSGTITSAQSFSSEILNKGIITEALGLGISISNVDAGAITTSYAVRVSGLAGTTQYGFYNDVSGSINVFTRSHIISGLATRYYDSDNSHYTGLAANATTTASVDYTLPAAGPASNGQALVSTTAGVMSFATIPVIASGKTFTVSNTLTLAGTDGTTMTFPTTSATIARTDAANAFTGASTASAWVLTSPTITTKLNPTSDDGAPLGDTTHNWSDLFLASGAVINYANSNVVLTHTSGVLTLGTGNLIITTAGTAAGSVATISGTQTLTNKRITKRVTSVADSATPTPNADTDDCYDLTALAQAAAFAAPSGTPTNFQTLIIRIKDNGTARALTWNSAYVAGGVALPSTTVLSKILTLGFIYNTANSLNKWQLTASAQEA